MTDSFVSQIGANILANKEKTNKTLASQPKQAINPSATQNQILRPVDEAGSKGENSLSDNNTGKKPPPLRKTRAQIENKKPDTFNISQDKTSAIRKLDLSESMNNNNRYDGSLRCHRTGSLFSSMGSAHAHKT